MHPSPYFHDCLYKIVSLLHVRESTDSHDDPLPVLASRESTDSPDLPVLASGESTDSHDLSVLASGESTDSHDLSVLACSVGIRDPYRPLGRKILGR
jgi:hypothetical protein